MCGSCMVLLIDCLVGVVAGIGVVACCWRLRRPLQWAQAYDGKITERGLYDDLPIYGYLRRYLLVLLFSGFVVLFTSTLAVILQLPEIVDFKPCGLTNVQLSILFGLFCVHLSTIAWFETARYQHQKPYRIQALVDDVRKRLWRIAVILLVAASLALVLRVADGV